MRVLVALLLLAVSVVPVQASSLELPAAIRVRDYTEGDCIADDTEGIRQAISDWHTAAATKQAGVLDFGSGCYHTTGTLDFGGPSDGSSNLFYFGEIHGDSSLLTRIIPAAGVSPAATFYNLKYSTVQGLGFGGAAKGQGVGILLSHTPPLEGMGTNNLTFQDINVQNFGTCVQMGGTDQGYANQAAAAAVTWIQLSAQFCTRGISYVAFNTLDTTFINTSLVYDDIGLDSNGGHQIFMRTGSSAYNGTTFWFHSTANYVVDGWRDEGDSDAWLRAGCCGAATFVSVRDSMIYGTLGKPAMVCSGLCNWIIQNSHIGGDILAVTGDGSMIIENSTIYSSAPWLFNPNSGPGSGMYYRQVGNYKPAGPANIARSNPYVKFPDLMGRAVNGHP